MLPKVEEIVPSRVSKTCVPSITQVNSDFCYIKKILSIFEKFQQGPYKTGKLSNSAWAYDGRQQS